MSRGWDIFDVSCIIAHIDEERCSLGFCHCHVVGITVCRGMERFEELTRPLSRMLWRDHGFFVASARQNRNLTPEREGTSEHYPCNYALLKAASCTAKMGPNFHESVFWKKPYSKLTVCALFILQAKAVRIALLSDCTGLKYTKCPGQS
jgi:hypothetical protein